MDITRKIILNMCALCKINIKSKYVKILSYFLSQDQKDRQIQVQNEAIKYFDKFSEMQAPYESNKTNPKNCLLH